MSESLYEFEPGVWMTWADNILASRDRIIYGNLCLELVRYEGEKDVYVRVPLRDVVAAVNVDAGS